MILRMGNKKYGLYLFMLPFLMAFQCEDDFGPALVFQPYRVQITANNPFSLNDTIWIEGRTSTLAFDPAINDSVSIETPQGDTFSIYKLISPTNISNTKDAIDQFDLIDDLGLFSFLPACENAEITAEPLLDNTSNFYRYRIGLIPKSKGEFVISFRSAVLENVNRNVSIIENYLISNTPNQIGFDNCGRISIRLLDESDKEYFFSIL